jgi:hypothetical protein
MGSNRREVTKAGSLNRVIDGCPLRGAGMGFKLRDFGGNAGIDQPP